MKHYSSQKARYSANTCLDLANQQSTISRSHRWITCPWVAFVVARKALGRWIVLSL